MLGTGGWGLHLSRIFPITYRLASCNGDAHRIETIFVRNAKRRIIDTLRNKICEFILIRLAKTGNKHGHIGTVIPQR